VKIRESSAGSHALSHGAPPIVRFQIKEDVAMRIERPLANQSTTFKVAQVKVGSTLRLR